MWKSLVIFGVVFALAPITMSQQQQASDDKLTQQHHSNTEQTNPPSPTITNNQSSTYHEQGNEDKPQGWHKLIAWPEGITAWALMFTLAAIIWQAVETRRSVNLGTRALVTNFRPKVIVRSIKLDPPATVFYDRRGDGAWEILINLTNTGGTEAKVKRFDALFQMYSDRDVPIDTVGIVWTPAFDHEFLLLPGSQHILRGVLTDGQSFRNSLHSIESSTASHNIQLRRPTCHGTITYIDGNGFERKTGFMREWKVGIQRFAVVDDPEYEYQD